MPPLKEAQAIGEKIRKTRNEKALTQAELAERAGISLPFLKRVELGQATLSAPFLGRIARTLQRPADDFLEEVETDEELANRLWGEHGLEKQMDVQGRFDLTTKKNVLRSLGLWKRL